MLGNFFIKVIVLITLSEWALLSCAETTQRCGETLFRIEIRNKENNASRQFLLYGTKGTEPEALLHTTESGGYFFVRCIKSKEKKPLILFQEIERLDTGPEDTYGIFDATTQKMLINPKDWPDGNEEYVEKLLGRRPPFLNGESGGYFCCFNGDY